LFTSWMAILFIVFTLIAAVWGIFYNKSKIDFV